MAFPFKKQSCKKTITIKEYADICCEFEVLPHIFNSYAVVFCPSIRLHEFITRDDDSRYSSRTTKETVYSQEYDGIGELRYRYEYIGHWVDYNKRNYGTWTANGYYDGYPITIRGWALYGYNYIEYMYDPALEGSIQCLIDEIKASEEVAKNKYRYVFDHCFPVDGYPDCFNITDDQKKILKPIASIIEKKLNLNHGYPAAWHVLMNKNTGYPYLEVDRNKNISITLFASGLPADEYREMVGNKTYVTLVKAWEVEYFAALMSVDCGVTEFKFNYAKFDRDEEYYYEYEDEEEQNFLNVQYEDVKTELGEFIETENVLGNKSNNYFYDYEYSELIEMVGLVCELPKKEESPEEGSEDDFPPFC